MINLYIDNVPVSVKKNSTVLQACDSLGIDVPRFCFHERLLIAGNCRMCLVEIEKSPKPVASCALPVSEGMKVFTKTPLVKKAQEGVLEFLLLNHPLDCPICDQGGECDLQDQAMIFGSDSSRFYEYKRGVEDKNCGPLIKTIMTRCIHCTRCVRFSTEIAGVPDLGTLGRGTHTQIGTYLEKTLSSELSGNIIDLCPVGALTSKPYAFKARSWELKSINSVDTMDSCGSNIVLSVKGSEVMRVLPRLNENINEEWISDKTRFFYDGLKVQRLSVPLVLDLDMKEYSILTWENALNLFFYSLSHSFYNLDQNLNIIFGKDVDIETVMILKYVFNKLNCFSLYADNKFCTNSLDFFYKFNGNIRDIDKHDLCIIVNCNTRFEASMLNLHLRKKSINGGLEVGVFGPSVNLTFPSKHLGLTTESFFDLIKGKHFFSKNLKKAKNPLFILNPSSFSNNELLVINNYLNENLQLFNGLNILNLSSGETGLKSIGVKSFSELLKMNSRGVDQSLNLYIGTNLNKKMLNFLSSISDFSVYCGSHGVNEASKSNIVFPGKVFTEKRSHYMNLEGLVQNTNRCSSSFVDARDDWKIFSAFLEYLKINLGLNAKSFDSFFLINKNLSYEFPFLNRVNLYNQSFLVNIRLNNFFFSSQNSLKVYKIRLVNFYRTNIVTSFSRIMLECSRNIKIKNFIS